MRRILLFTFYVIFITSVFGKSPHGDNFKLQCITCHTTDNWTKIKMEGFNHDSTDFPLVGQHKTVYCRKCHEDLQFKNAKKECASCHKDVHEGTLGRDCERCHTPSTWIVKNIRQIHQQSRFPLLGSHAVVDCYLCHKSASRLRFDPMKSDCIDCHLIDFNNATNPPHVASNFSKDCSLCHNLVNWQSTTFNHNATNFPLTGGHFGVDCIKCHANGYTATSSACVSCHLTNYNATTNPNHITAKFSTDCQTCHNTTAWSPSTFNHNTATTFPLTGAHIGITCTQCHTNGYGAIPTTCVSCHLASFNSTTNPNHVTSNFPTTCETCHSTTNWTNSTFNHSTSTTFPLTGAHIALACNLCHPTNYNAIPTTCVSCHLTNYNATTNPNHITAKFSTTCETCHSTTAWVPSTFNHSTSTTFPLTGAHIGIACATCHTNGYAAIPTTCVSCHLANYNATTNPNHSTSKFSTTCETCHSTTAWVPSTFNHSTSTTFPLTGAHIGLACTLCHPSNYNAIPTTCISCHLATYNATTNPNHVTANFPTTCETCHSTTNWTSSTFNHSTSTTFPLTGAHINLACTLCHPTNYKAIPTTCVSCHLATYNATTNPNHIAASFPTTCETCHSTTNWTSSTFNHTSYFPITSGNHNVSCATCHTNATNYAVFSCVTAACHGNAHHQNQGSAGCYSCHPTGRGG